MNLFVLKRDQHRWTAKWECFQREYSSSTKSIESKTLMETDLWQQKYRILKPWKMQSVHERILMGRSNYKERLVSANRCACFGRIRRYVRPSLEQVKIEKQLTAPTWSVVYIECTNAFNEWMRREICFVTIFPAMGAYKRRYFYLN